MIKRKKPKTFYGVLSPVALGTELEISGNILNE